MNKSDATPASQPVTKELVVQNKMGIHARPAAMIVRITNKFKAEVFVENKDEQVNGKSIMGLMMLAAGKGSKVKFIATGDDAATRRAPSLAVIFMKAPVAFWPGTDTRTQASLTSTVWAKAGRAAAAAIRAARESL